MLIMRVCIYNYRNVICIHLIDVFLFLTGVFEEIQKCMHKAKCACVNTEMNA